MIRWVQLDAAAVPDGGGELRLMRRGAELSIMAGAVELMNSRLSGSEQALALMACERLAGGSAPHLLIGGLGMGFTLRAALGALGPAARITVVELAPAVVRWARGPMAELFGESLSDPRVTIREADVAEVIRGARSTYDAILLDVDNGPEGLTRPANDALYSHRGLEEGKRALRPCGVLAVWSAVRDPAFTRRLQGIGFVVEEVPVRARGRRGARHVIWMATSPG